MLPLHEAEAIFGIEISYTINITGHYMTRHGTSAIANPIGDVMVWVGDVALSFEFPAVQIMRGNVFVPLSTIIDALEYNAYWHGLTRTVQITSPLEV